MTGGGHYRLEEGRQLLARLLALLQGQMPDMFWAAARDKEQASKAAAKLAQLRLERENLETNQLDPKDFYQSLQDFSAIYEHLDPGEQGMLLACLIDRVVLNEAKATMWMSSIEPQNENTQGSEYPECWKWLPRCPP